MACYVPDETMLIYDSTTGDVVLDKTATNYNDYLAFLNNLNNCFDAKDPIDEKDQTACDELSSIDCTQQLILATQKLNNASLQLQTDNKDLKELFEKSEHNTTISGIMFRMYKENAAVHYIKNIVIVIMILYLIYLITHMMSKTSEIKDIVNTIRLPSTTTITPTTT
jgi:hypothetical protein